MFQRCDALGEGSVDRGEFARALAAFGFALPQKGLQRESELLFRKFGRGSGRLDYIELNKKLRKPLGWATVRARRREIALSPGEAAEAELRARPPRPDLDHGDARLQSAAEAAEAAAAEAAAALRPPKPRLDQGSARRPSASAAAQADAASTPRKARLDQGGAGSGGRKKYVASIGDLGRAILNLGPGHADAALAPVSPPTAPLDQAGSGTAGRKMYATSVTSSVGNLGRAILNLGPGWRLKNLNV